MSTSKLLVHQYLNIRDLLQEVQIIMGLTLMVINALVVYRSNT